MKKDTLLFCSCKTFFQCTYAMMIFFFENLASLKAILKAILLKNLKSKKQNQFFELKNDYWHGHIYYGPSE